MGFEYLGRKSQGAATFAAFAKVAKRQVAARRWRDRRFLLLIENPHAAVGFPTEICSFGCNRGGFSIFRGHHPGHQHNFAAPFCRHFISVSVNAFKRQGVGAVWRSHSGQWIILAIVLGGVTVCDVAAIGGRALVAPLHAVALRHYNARFFLGSRIGTSLRFFWVHFPSSHEGIPLGLCQSRRGQAENDNDQSCHESLHWCLSLSSLAECAL